METSVRIPLGLMLTYLLSGAMSLHHLAMMTQPSISCFLLCLFAILMLSILKQCCSVINYTSTFKEGIEGWPTCIKSIGDKIGMAGS